MLNAVIIDDEQHCQDRIVKLLKGYPNVLQLVGTFDNVEAAYDGILRLRPDVIFLDVHLNDKTGFDLLRSFEEISFEIIFTTAYDKYAINAFKFSAVDYLLKPISTEEFGRVIGKLEEKVSLKSLEAKMATLFHNLEPTGSQPKRIAIPTVDGFTYVQIKDIVRCNADVNYTHLFTKEGEKFTVARTLKTFEELLTPHNFLRIHNSHLINLSYVSKYTKGKGGYITMKDGTEVEVSVRKKEIFLKKTMALE
ncbi:MAG: LytTR family DNA-binding domain-containing protein [Bacteroidota bacterium]